jgi:hypothetical protein
MMTADLVSGQAKEPPSKPTYINQPNAPRGDTMISKDASFTLIEDVPVHSFTLIEGML